MLTVPEAARRIRRNPETVRRWIREGRLSSQRVGTQHLIDEGELDAMIATSSLPLPEPWRRTATGEPMPAIVEALERSRSSR